MKKTSCKTIQALLYLHRPGELAEREQIKLQQHLTECPECAAIAAQLGILQNHIADLAAPEITLTEPAALTANIMNSVSLMKRMTNYRTEGVLTRVLQVLFNPRFRLSLASALVLVAGLFIFQESVFMIRISALEKKMQYSANAMTSTASVNRLAAMHNALQKLETTAAFTNMEQESLAQDLKLLGTDQDLLALLMENNENLKIQNELLLKLLQQKNPDFYNTLIKADLEQPNINKIIQNKRYITRLLRVL
ncbi:MAG TPA: zf-HC2 domain-containing protein [bacterium]|nr:zf-HC2 domain-containing protein [bacterium]HPN43807.1 zf-HC2 domain-containing protein [bacterium]